MSGFSWLIMHVLQLNRLTVYADYAPSYACGAADVICPLGQRWRSRDQLGALTFAANWQSVSCESSYNNSITESFGFFNFLRGASEMQRRHESKCTRMNRNDSIMRFYCGIELRDALRFELLLNRRPLASWVIRCLLTLTLINVSRLVCIVLLT